MFKRKKVERVEEKKVETQFALVNLSDNTMKDLVRIMDENDINDFNKAIELLIKFYKQEAEQNGE